MLPDAILAEPGLFAVFCALLASSPTALPAAPPYPILALPYPYVCKLLESQQSMTEAGAASAIDGWCDNLALWRCGDMVEVLVPASLRRFKQMVDADDLLRAARVLVTTLHGFAGGSAGHSNEALICRFIHTHTSILVPRTRDDALALRASGAAWVAAAGTGGGGGAGGGGAGGGGAAAAGAVALDDVLQCVLPWTSEGHETGIDRVWLTDGGAHPATGGRCAVVNGLQLKTGRQDLKVTAGVLHTQRGHIMEKVDDGTLAGILVKAERGFCALLRALHAAFPDVAWRLGKFCIFTTKRADDGAEALHPNPHTIHEERSAAIRDSGAVAAGDPLQFSWTVCSGTGWLREILPPRIASLALAP